MSHQHNPVQLLSTNIEDAIADSGLLPEGDQDRRWLTLGNGVRIIYSLVLIIPLFYNPDTSGRRRPVETAKLDRTKAEIEAWFGGYTAYRANGRGQDAFSGKRSADTNIVFSIDAPPEQLEISRLRKWRRALETRFDQDRIWMTVGGPLIHI